MLFIAYNVYMHSVCVVNNLTFMMIRRVNLWRNPT